MDRSYFLLPLLAALICSCSEPPAGPPEIVIPADTEPIIFSKHIQPIFVNSCDGASCHISGTGLGAELSLTSWQSIMEGSRYGALIIPYSSRTSHLFQHINADTSLAPLVTPRMPLGRNPLPLEQIRLIRRWIDEGAKNDAGEVSLGDQSRQRIFVTARKDDAVTVIDFATERIARFVKVGTQTPGKLEGPHSIVLSPDGGHYYVALVSGGRIEKYNSRTFEKVASVAVGIAPEQIVVSSDGSRLYASNYDSTLSQSFIVSVNPITMTIADTVHDVGRAPCGIIPSPDGKFIYTLNVLGDDITEIDATTNKVVRHIPASPGNPLPVGGTPRIEPYRGAFSKDGRFLWFTCRSSNDVRILDVGAGTILDSIAVGDRPSAAAFTPDGGEFWVPNNKGNSISVISVGFRRVVNTISNVYYNPFGITFRSDGRIAYVACENLVGSGHHGSGPALSPGLVYILDASSHDIRRVIETGRSATGLVIGPP